jgi:acyl-CoA hydrolase
LLGDDVAKTDGPAMSGPEHPRETRFIEMIFPEQANHYGTLFAGNGMSLVGKAAFVAATRFARCPIVLASSDKIKFHTPVKVGELVEIIARVERVGRSSITVSVKVMAEALLTGEQRLAVSGTCEMVAVDGNGRAAAIPSEIRSEDAASTKKESVS